jgi:hypothetical protein
MASIVESKEHPTVLIEIIVSAIAFIPTCYPLFMKEMRVIIIIVIDMHVGIENQLSSSSCCSSYSQLGGVQTNGS